MFWNVWPNFWAGFLNCLFVEFLVCSILLDSFYVILLLWIVKTSYQLYIYIINTIYLYLITVFDIILHYMVCKFASECVHLASLTASKTDHSHSCCWGDAKRTRLEGSHGEVPGVFLCVLWFWAMWVRHPNSLKWDLMIWPRTTEPTKAGNNNPSSQLFSFSGRPSSTSLTTLQGIWSSWRLVSIGSSTACGWRQRYRVPTSAEMPKAPCRKWETKTHGIGNVEGFVHRKMEHS